ncbi:hypothetical protein RRG08_061864 [Elysia crispata]|uniref:Uncharacterized protein n=1 Tax=Elysia crispata TaxID=231223 RepID=A0AAE0XM10_9GAST|nr:hypothetical protein RRG08_061864 [Elysia crispata]
MRVGHAPFGAVFKPVPREHVELTQDQFCTLYPSSLTPYTHAKCAAVIRSLHATRPSSELVWRFGKDSV